MIKKSADAFMEKLSSVFDFKNFYTKEACLVEAAILETDQKLNKKYGSGIKSSDYTASGSD